MSQPVQRPNEAVTTRTRRIQPSNKATAQAAAKRAEQRRQMIRWFSIGLAIAMVALVALIVLNRWGADASLFPGGPRNAATVVAGPPLSSSAAINGTTLGDATAPILVVEYGDYQNRAATAFARDSMTKLISEYVANGTIRFEYRPLPLSDLIEGQINQDGESFRAAEASLCAADQDLFWQYHGVLSANVIGVDKGSFTADRLKTLATKVPEMDTARFNTCLDQRIHAGQVLGMANQAGADGIETTPTFLVNGQPVTGANYEELSNAIKSQLAGP